VVATTAERAWIPVLYLPQPHTRQVAVLTTASAAAGVVVAGRFGLVGFPVWSAAMGAKRQMTVITVLIRILLLGEERRRHERSKGFV
jgi:hypothetical protein